MRINMEAREIYSWRHERTPAFTVRVSPGAGQFHEIDTSLPRAAANLQSPHPPFLALSEDRSSFSWVGVYSRTAPGRCCGALRTSRLRPGTRETALLRNRNAPMDGRQRRNEPGLSARSVLFFICQRPSGTKLDIHQGDSESPRSSRNEGPRIRETPSVYAGKCDLRGITRRSSAVGTTLEASRFS
jgi:hypothetical protein